MRTGDQRRWLPALAVLGVLGVATLGGFVAAAALAEPVGSPLSIPGAVSVQPLSGWRPEPPGRVDGRPFVRLTRGSGTLVAIAWGQVSGDAEALAIAVRDDVLDRSLDRLTVSESLTEVALDRGLRGRRFTFTGVDRDSGASVEGEVTAVVDERGQGVAFVGLAPEGLLAFIDGDLHTMIERATVGGA
jgi:hypothetical protein